MNSRLIVLRCDIRKTDTYHALCVEAPWRDHQHILDTLRNKRLFCLPLSVSRLISHRLGELMKLNSACQDIIARQGDMLRHTLQGEGCFNRYMRVSQYLPSKAISE